MATRTIDRDDARVLAITVADTGRGMTPAQAAMIFEHFYSTKEGGGGLGLSIVRRLVTDLHGTIRVESEPGHGTRMIVEIPTVQSQAGARAADQPTSLRPSGARRRW
jgi:signal transduction histidine kinase